MGTHAKFATFSFTQLDSVVGVMPDVLPGSDSLGGVEVGKMSMTLIDSTVNRSRGCNFEDSSLEFGDH